MISRSQHRSAQTSWEFCHVAASRSTEKGQYKYTSSRNFFLFFGRSIYTNVTKLNYFWHSIVLRWSTTCCCNDSSVSLACVAQWSSGFNHTCQAGHSSFLSEILLVLQNYIVSEQTFLSLTSHVCWQSSEGNECSGRRRRQRMHFRHWVHLVHRLFPLAIPQPQFAQKASTNTTDILHIQLFHFNVLANFCREIKFYLQKKSIRLIRKRADPTRSVGVAIGQKRPDQILFWLWHRRTLCSQRNYPNLCRLVGV